MVKKYIRSLEGFLVLAKVKFHICDFIKISYPKVIECYDIIIEILLKFPSDIVFHRIFFVASHVYFLRKKIFFFRENLTKFKVLQWLNARKEERWKIKNVRLEIKAYMKYVSVMPWFFFSISHIMIIMIFFAIHCTNERIKLQEEKHF